MKCARVPTIPIPQRYSQVSKLGHSHTGIAGIKVIGIRIITIQVIIAWGVSVRVSFLTIKAFIEWAKAAIMASIIPNENVLTPGWTIMSIPIMPIIIAAILLALIISPKKMVAPIVINIGFEKLIAVAWASGIKVSNGQVNFTGLTPGRLYIVEVSDSSSCTYGLTRAVRIPTALDYDPAIVEKTDSYCVTGTIGNGSILTTPLDGAGNQLNAFSGGSGVYTYRWVRSDTGSTVIYGVGANLYNIAPGDYYVTCLLYTSPSPRD